MFVLIFLFNYYNLVFCLLCDQLHFFHSFFVAVSCESLNNCSYNGDCTGPNVCSCHSGFKGLNCSEGILHSSREHLTRLKLLLYFHETGGWDMVFWVRCFSNKLIIFSLPYVKRFWRVQYRKTIATTVINTIKVPEKCLTYLYLLIFFFNWSHRYFLKVAH